MMTTVRAACSVILQFGFYVYILLLIGVPATLAGWQVAAGALGLFPGGGLPGDPGGWAVWIPAVVALLAAISAVRLLRKPPVPRGLVVGEQQAPDLWATARDLAAAVGTRPPDEIRLVADATVAVREDTRLPGLRAGRRYLILGLPLLQAATVSQLRAMLAHELSHHAAPGRLHATATRGAYLIRETMAGLGPRARGRRLLLSGYASLYARISRAAVRAREVAADAAAVRLAGQDAAISALAVRRDTALAWTSYRLSLRAGEEHRLAPEQVLGGFPSWLAGYTEQRAQWRERGDPDLEPEPPAGPSHRTRWDPHPPDRDRIARMERALAGPPPDNRPATALLPDPEATAAELDRVEFGRAGRDRLPIDEYHTEIERREGRLPADRLYRAAARVTGTGSLETVLELLATGWQDRLAEAMLPPAALAEPEDTRDDLVDALQCAVAHALVDSGAAQWRPGWTEPVGPDGSAIDGHRLAERALSGEAAAVRDELAGRGVDLAAATAEHPAPTPHGAHVYGVITGTLVNGTRRDMVVMNLGVTLLAPAGGPDAAHRPTERDLPPEELAAVPGHRYVAYEEIAAARPRSDHRKQYLHPAAIRMLRPFREELTLHSGERLLIEADRKSGGHHPAGPWFINHVAEFTPVDAETGWQA